MQVDPEIARILLEADSFGQTLRRLVELKRERVASYSLAVMGRRSGLSKSYLSELIAGKKTIALKHIPDVGRALGLGFLEMACLQAFAEVEHTRDVAKRPEALEKVVKAKRVLRLLAQDENHPQDVDLLAFDLYASFGLFGMRPSLDDLCSLFSNRPRLELIRCLDYLIGRKAIVRHGDSTFTYTDHGLVFSSDKNVRSFVPFWQNAARDAIANMPRWAERREDSCFSSYVISVEREEYRRQLEILKGRLLEFASTCDSAHADSLVRINVQVYPVKVTDGS